MQTFNGFIITSHYELSGDDAIIHIFGRLDNGQSFELTKKFKPYFFIKTSDEEFAKTIIKGEIISTNLKNLSNHSLSKVTINNPSEISPLRKVLEDKNIPCFEADIRFTQRFFIDNNILSTIKITGSYEKGEFSDLYFVEPIISSSSINNIKPRLLSLDIETTPTASKIFSISLHQESEDSLNWKSHEEVLVVSNDKIEEQKNNLSNATIVDSEKELLVLFFNRLKELDSDILTGWHVIDFDFQVIAKRAKHFNIPFIIGRTNIPAQLRLEQSFFRDSNLRTQGRIILDGIQLLKSSFINLDNYKLNTAAKHFLGETKLIQSDDRGTIIEDQYLHSPQEFINYNLNDSILVTKILHESGVLNLTIQRALLTGLHMDNVKASIASFDSLYLRDLRKEGFVANTNRSFGDDEGLGGFVMTSKPGLYDNILVLDFKSLYPSLMRTFNIDPLAFQGDVNSLDKNIKLSKEKYILAPNGAVFLNNHSILPKILKRLWIARDEARKNGNELARYAIKILMNSMYGVLASRNSRFHNRTLSNSITYFAQFFIKLTASRLQDQGFEVIYGDTDSVFVNVKIKDKSLAHSKGLEIEKYINSFLKKYVKDNYSRDSILEIEFEKLFLKLFMPKARGSDVGAKKRYAGLRENQDGSTFIDFTGLEFVRKDWTKVSKKFQMALLDLIFSNKPVNDYIKKFVQDINSGKYDSLLVYKKSLRKDLDSYTKTTPPHVKAARMLDKLTSSVIEYVITINGPEPLEKLSSKLDYDHYINKQIKPIADSILELQGTTFEEVISGVSQKGLGDFF